MIMNAAKLAVYEAVNAKQRHAQIFAMNLLAKPWGCLATVAALNNRTHTSHNEFPNENLLITKYK